MRCASFGATPEATPQDASSNDGETAGEAGVEGGGTNCPQTKGPPMVLVDGVCVDAWEVTFGDLRPYIGPFAKGVTLPARCNGVDSIADIGTGCGGSPGSTTDDLPASCVSWCEAYAYCATVGKHLCGKLGGGPVESTSAHDPAVSEWGRVCKGADGKRTFPTGDPPGASCNVGSGGLSNGKKALPHDRNPDCQGPPGVFDLAGNLLEWLDACGAQGDDKKCVNGGDSFANTNIAGEPGACTANDIDPIDIRTADKGFRCCATPQQ